jgi:hypothetical protein
VAERAMPMNVILSLSFFSSLSLELGFHTALPVLSDSPKPDAHLGGVTGLRKAVLGAQGGDDVERRQANKKHRCLLFFHFAFSPVFLGAATRLASGTRGSPLRA